MRHVSALRTLIARWAEGRPTPRDVAIILDAKLGALYAVPHLWGEAAAEAEETHRQAIGLATLRLRPHWLDALLCGAPRATYTRLIERMLVGDRRARLSDETAAEIEDVARRIRGRSISPEDRAAVARAVVEIRGARR
jgi:hypothetical protein